MEKEDEASWSSRLMLAASAIILSQFVVALLSAQRSSERRRSLHASRKIQHALSGCILCWAHTQLVKDRLPGIEGEKASLLLEAYVKGGLYNFSKAISLQSNKCQCNRV